MTNKTQTERAEELYPKSTDPWTDAVRHIQRTAYIRGRKEERTIADAEISKLKEQLSKEWVSVDTPPEKPMMVIAGYFYMVEFMQEIIFYDGISGFSYFTHWQPLPPSPLKLTNHE